MLIFNSCKDDKNQKISINSHYWKCLAYYYTLIYSDECPYLGCCRNSASTIVPSSLQVSPGNFNLNPLFNSCGKSVLIPLPMPEDILVNYSYLICLCDVTSLFYWTRVYDYIVTIIIKMMTQVWVNQWIIIVITFFFFHLKNSGKNCFIYF